MDVCTCGCLLGSLVTAAGVSEACRPADEAGGLRFPSNLPLSVVYREAWTFKFLV